VIINKILQQAKWDQEKFEWLLAEWMVMCDQPFSEVDKPLFQRVLEYTHLQPSLDIPHHHPMKQWIMKMGEDTVEKVKRMIGVGLFPIFCI